MQIAISPAAFADNILGDCTYRTGLRSFCRARKAIGSQYCKRHKRVVDADEQLREKLRAKNNAAPDLWPGQRLTQIYFVRCGDAVKIGHATNAKARAAAIQTGSAESVLLMAFFYAPAAVEKQLHAALAEHRIRGEWFRNCPEIEILAALAREGQPQNIKAFIDSA